MSDTAYKHCERGCINICTKDCCNNSISQNQDSGPSHLKFNQKIKWIHLQGKKFFLPFELIDFISGIHSSTTKNNWIRKVGELEKIFLPKK